MTDRKPLKESYFGRRLRELREAAGLSRYALARTAGVTDQALANLEAGAAPSLATAVGVARALGVPVADLVEPDDEKTH